MSNVSMTIAFVNFGWKLLPLDTSLMIFEPSCPCASYMAALMYWFWGPDPNGYTKSSRNVLPLTRTKYWSFSHCTWLSKVGPISICSISNLARVVKSQLLPWQLLPTMFLIYVPPPFFPTLCIKLSPSSCSVCTLFCGMKTCGKELEFKWFLV